MQGWLHQAVFAPAGAYAAGVKEEIGRIRTDAVICIDVLFGGLLGAEAAGVPFAILSPHVSVRPLPGLPPATTGLLPPRTATERDDINAVTAQYLGLVDGFRPTFNATRAELSLRRSTMFSISSIEQIWPRGFRHRPHPPGSSSTAMKDVSAKPRSCAHPRPPHGAVGAGVARASGGVRARHRESP
jgi:hypothetical protein